MKSGVKLLRKAFQEVALTTDIIVGFPGETEEEFKVTYNFLKKIKFSKMHIFKYSRRKGTPAYSMKNQIDGNIKEKRSQKLIELSNKNEEEFLRKYIGRKVEVLFEQPEGTSLKGHTSNYMIVKTNDKVYENELKEILIEKIDKLELVGKIL